MVKSNHSSQSHGFRVTDESGSYHAGCTGRGVHVLLVFQRPLAAPVSPSLRLACATRHEEVPTLRSRKRGRGFVLHKLRAQ